MVIRFGGFELGCFFSFGRERKVEPIDCSNLNGYESWKILKDYIELDYANGLITECPSEDLLADIEVVACKLFSEIGKNQKGD